MFRRHSRSLTLSAAAVFALLAAACSGSIDELSTATDSTATDSTAVATTAETSSTTTVSTTTAAIETATAPETVEESAPKTTAPAESGVQESGIFDFEATLLGGDAFESSDYTGRDVLVWFWAPW